MNFIAFTQLEHYEHAVILPQGRTDETSLFNFYESKLSKPCLYIGFILEGKSTVGNCRKHWEMLREELKARKVRNVYIADSMYFKGATKLTSTTKYDSEVIKQDDFNILYGMNYGVLQYNPSAIDKLNHSISLFNQLILNGNIEVDTKHRLIKIGSENDLNFLLNKPLLACDIETTGLNVYTSEIKTIAFAWSATESMVMKYTPKLKYFFNNYKGELIFHNASFDLKMLIFHLYMSGYRDLPSARKFLQNSPKIHDTQVLAYLNRNSVDKPLLSLKELVAQEFGRYAVDVKDIEALDPNVLMEYNAKDTMATYWLYEQEKQESDLYGFYMNSLKNIIYVELCGMRVDTNKVDELEATLLKSIEAIEAQIDTSVARELIEEQELIKVNSRLKTKQYEHINCPFNFNSKEHLATLLYDVHKLPVLALTESGKRSTDTNTLKKLDHPIAKLLVDRSAISKLLSAFIPVFKKAIITPEGSFINGSFNLTATVSGRLSSSNPNLQQLPSNSAYGKAVKKLFTAPKGWLMVGADFNALEGRINALITKDPNKMKVYTEGYDSHCVNAYAYWGDKMPDIENTVESINSIKDKYPELRQASKAVTFACNYSGTWKTLHKNCGFSIQEAKQIEQRYHDTYKQSDIFLEEILKKASKQGYVDLAFGLKLRTPKLKTFGYESQKKSNEARTVNNAVTGQSYSLLTNRALNAVMKRVWASKYADDVLPICLIHDALYFYIKDNQELVEWFNDVLVEEMSWNDLPEIKSEEIPMSAEMEIFHPSWAEPIGVNDYYENKEKH